MSISYTFNGSGKIRFFGCPIINLNSLYPSKFAIGEVLYILRKARLGVFEKIGVKKVNLFFKGHQPIFMYKDTFNRIHDENTLCRYPEAQQEAESFKNYLEELIMKIGGCGVSQYYTSSVTSPNDVPVGVTLKKLKNLVNKMKSNSFKTEFINSDIKAAEILKEIERVLLDGGTP